MSRVLLLGKNGQVGWELQRALAGNPGLVALDRAQADFTRPESLRAAVREHKPDLILNAAAYTAVDAAEQDEATATLVNGESVGVLAEEARRLGALLAHYSTDYVFDGRARRPYREDDAVGPLSGYGRSKLAGERAIADSGCRHLILRTSWVYAGRGKNFLLMMLRLACDPARKELRVVADQFGAPTWARSIAQVTVDLTRLAGSRGASGIFNLSCAGSTSWHGFASRIVERGAARGLCRPLPVRAIATSDYPTPARRPAWSVLDGTRLRDECGLGLPTWERALEDCLAELALARPAPPASLSPRDGER